MGAVLFSLDVAATTDEQQRAACEDARGLWTSLASVHAKGGARRPARSGADVLAMPRVVSALRATRVGTAGELRAVSEKSSACEAVVLDRSLAPPQAGPPPSPPYSWLGWDLDRVQCTTVRVPDRVQLGGGDLGATVVGRVSTRSAEGSTVGEGAAPVEARPVPRFSRVAEHLCAGAYGSWCQVELRPTARPKDGAGPPALLCNFVCGFAGEFVPHAPSSSQARPPPSRRHRTSRDA